MMNNLIGSLKYIESCKTAICDHVSLSKEQVHLLAFLMQSIIHWSNRESVILIASATHDCHHDTKHKPSKAAISTSFHFFAISFELWESMILWSGQSMAKWSMKCYRKAKAATISALKDESSAPLIFMYGT